MLANSAINNGPPEWENMGFTDGIIKYEGGSSEDVDLQIDDGVLDFYEGAGAGGNDGNISWSWNGVDGFEKEVVSADSGFQPGANGEIWYQDLQNEVGLLCTAQGTGLTGTNNYVEDYKATGNYWEHDDPTITELIAQVEGLEYPVTETYSLKEADEAMAKTAELDKKVQSYEKYFRTSSKYTGVDKECTPAEAIVLSEVDNCTIGSPNEYTPIQNAGWAVTKSGSGGNEISEAAFDFQNYVNTAAGGERTQYTTEDGQTFTGFAIDIDPNFTSTSKEATVSFDSISQKYILGPFRIDYVDYKPFSFINNMEIYTDNSQTPVSKDQYYLAVSENDELVNLNGEYPSSGDEFYIILNYNENFKKLTDIQVDFKYMNAGGHYTYYTGTYTKVAIKGHIYGRFDYGLYEEISAFSEWLAEQLEADKGIVLGSTISDLSAISYVQEGETLKDAIERRLNKAVDNEWNAGEMAIAYQKYYYTNQYDSLTDMAKHWLEEYRIFDPNTSERYILCSSDEIEVNKMGQTYNLNAYRTSQEMLDWIESDLTRFREELKKAEEEENEEDIARYKNNIELYTKMKSDFEMFHSGIEAGLPARDSRVIPGKLSIEIWKDYEFIDQGEVTAQDQSASRGAARWWEYETIHWNQELPSNEEGKIKIVKETDGQAKNGDEFNFKVTVNNGNQTTTENLKIVYQEGTENSVESQVYTWAYGSTAPTYTVEEVNLPSNSSLVSIENQSGSLSSGQTVTVKAKNKITENYGNLSISKQIETTNLDTNQYTLVGKIYKFNVTISGADCSFNYGGQDYTVTPEKSVTIPIQIESVADTASQEEKDAKSVKITNIKFYEDAPQYKVEEIIDETVPEGSAVQEIRQSEGYISKGATSEVIAINKYELKEDEEKASIGVIKTLDGDSNFSDEDLQKFEFKFRVKVFADSAHTIPFKNLAGEPYSEQIITAKASRSDSGTWEWRGQTDEYIWAYGNNPYYEIEEIDTCPVHGD